MTRLPSLFLLLAPLLLIASVAQAQANDPAPPLSFAAGSVLAGGHELAEDVMLPPTAGPVTLRVRDGAPLRWRVAVENGETRLLDGAGRWAAKAEYHRLMRDGSAVCQIYQTTISPEWALQRGDRPGRPDFSPADDRIYSFRDVPCP
ncbi:MAG: hypothetical protein ACK4FK_14795 [Ferrovibrio sp.]|jgi:hypothetical protein|uniref:hypothetical protein n=1 Tax=Ferrovibrio sp. TaxID=1917215 RepID=UPI003919493A